MSTPAELLQWFSEWRRLTDAEGEAIAAAAWATLLEVQSAKARLQVDILGWERACAPQSVRDFPALRPLLGEIIGLEARNRDRLARLDHEARVERESLDRSRRDLRRLQGSFAAPATPAWESYS